MRSNLWTLDTVKPERPFNRPRGLAGRMVFAFLAALESAISRASKVGVGPFFEPAAFPWIADLRAEWPYINDELQAVLHSKTALPPIQAISPEIGYITTDDDWKTFMLVGYGVRAEANLARCPRTATALARIPGMRTAFFSLLEAGKRLPPHRGPFNGVLRLHLGLLVPRDAGNCWIRVGGEQRHWESGQVLVFDDAYVHEVHNATDEPRVVLFIDFLRPCRWPVSWISRLVVFLARFSSPIRRARARLAAWERRASVE